MPYQKNDAGDIFTERYFKTIKDFKRISNKEDLVLLERLRNDKNDTEALETLIKSKISISIHLAEKFMGRGVPFVDLIQEANVGILVAVRLFDPSKNVTFVTFAFRIASSYIHNFLVRKLGIVRVPFRVKNSETHIGYFGPANGSIFSLDALREKMDEEDPLLISVDPFKDMEDLEYVEKMREVLNSIMNKFKSKDKKIIELIYGFDDGESKSFSRVAEMIGCSRQNIAVRHKIALDRFRKHKKELVEFV